MRATNAEMMQARRCFRWNAAARSWAIALGARARRVSMISALTTRPELRYIGFAATETAAAMIFSKLAIAVTLATGTQTLIFLLVRFQRWSVRSQGAVLVVVSLALLRPSELERGPRFVNAQVGALD